MNHLKTQRKSGSALRPARLALFAMMLVLIGASQLHGQAAIANYVFSTNTTGSLALDRNSNTVNMSTGTTQLIGPSTASAGSGLFNIGFDFFFYGTRYTQISVTSNGLIGMGAALVAGGNSFLGGNNRLSITNANGMTATAQGTSATGKVHYKVVGAAPFRTLVVEWLNMSATSTSGTADFTCQMRLYEETGIIEYVYGNAAIGNAGTQTWHIGISSNTASSYQTVNTATGTASINTIIANNYSNGTIADLNSAANGSRRTYTWIPTSAAVPTGINFTAVTANGMTVNWTDVATDEVGYVLYESHDGGVTYNYVTQLAANTVTYPATGLLSSTSYMWRVLVLRESLGTPLLGTQATTAATNVTAIASGLWSQTTTWSTGLIPTTADNAVIPAGFTVTIDMAAVAQFVDISGTLEYEATTARSLTVGESVTVNAGGTFRSNLTGTVTTHTFTVGRNLTNNGTLDFSTNANTAGAGITFNTVNSATFSMGAASVTNLRTASLNKGTSIATSLTFTPGGTFTVQGANTAGFLTITNGLFEINGTAAFMNPVFASATYTIPLSGGFRLNNASATVTGLTGSCTTNGMLRISQGNYIIGTATDNSMGFGTGANLTVEGGTLTAAGRIQTANAVTVNISGGTINVAAVGSTNTAASFGFTSATNSFTMSGGTINLVQASTGVTVDYNVAGILNITGGTLNVGTTATATNFTFRIQGTTPNCVIDNTTNTKTALASGALSINGNLTINTGSTLNAQANTIIVAGMSVANPGNVVNNGTITNTSATGANRMQFSSTFGAQTYSGTGVFGTVALAFAGINVSNASGVTINAPIITNRVNLFTGTVNNASNITVGFGAASAPTIQVGGTATVTAGSFATAPTFNIGTGGLTLNYATSLAAVTTGNEVPTPRTALNLVIGNTPGVTVSGGAITVTGTLTLTSGILTTTAVNYVEVTATTVASVTGGSATSYVNGPLRRALPASLVTGSTYAFPIGKSGYNPLEMVNPTTNAGGPVSVSAEVFDANSGGSAGAGLFSINTNRYWATSLTAGAGNFTNTTIRLTETGLGGGSRVAESATQTGVYTAAGGTVVGNTVLSTTPSTSMGFFAVGTTSSSLSGTYPVGASAPTYQKLTQVAAALNTSTVTGDVIFEMQSDYDGTTGETFPISFIQYTTTGAFKVTIRPAAAATNLITSGDPGSGNANIVMNGVDNLTFDGRPGGIGVTSQWTFRNTRTAATVGSTFAFQNDATVDTLKYLKIEGQNTAAAQATVFFGTSTGTLGNSNNVLLANDIRDRSDVAGVPNTAVSSAGTAAAPNNNNKLMGNTIRNFTANGVSITSNSNSWTIGGTVAADGNNVYQEAARATAFTSINVAAGNSYVIGFNNIYQTAGINTSSMTGIAVTGSGNGHTIRNNNIGGSNATRTGAAMISNAGSTSYGISVTAGTTTATNIYSNWISNWGVLSTSTSSIANGIYVAGGNVNIGTLGGNTIGGAVVSGVPSDTVVTSYDNGWINLAGGTTLVVENNTVTNAAYYRGANDRNCGIYAATGASITVRNNTIRALKGNNTSSIGSTFIVMGIYAPVSGTVVEGNYIEDLWNFNTTATTTATKGIFWNATSGIIRNNRIVNIRSTSTQTGTNAANLYGILIYSGAPAVYNNRISMGMNVTNEARVYGIYENTTSNPGAAISYNTVYITGAGAAGTQNSYAFLRATSAANTLRNNLFFNERTGGGANFAIGNTNATPATNWSATTSNYNYFITGNVATVGMWGTTPCTLAQWRTNSGGDAQTNSNDAASLPAATLFVSPSTGNLKINTAYNLMPSDLESKGIAVAGITTDFENDVRPGPVGSVNGGGTAPDIGADEYDGTPLTVDAGITALVLPGTTGCHTSCETVRVRIHNYSTAALNMATNPVTVNASVTGPNATTFTPLVISSGTIPAGGNLDTAVTVCYNMTAAGTYVFSASTAVTGDGNASNNSMTAVSILNSGGTVSVSPSPLCLGSPTTLNLSNFTSGGTIQWQSSPDNVTWTNIASATTNGYSTTPTDTMYYRAIVCGSLTSTVDTAVTIDVTPAVTVNDSICGTGVVNLSATGNGTLNWYTASVGGTPINTGATYAPTISATTTYYVENSFVSVVAGSPAAPTCYPNYNNACSSSDFINNFSTTGGITNISNLNSGCNGIFPTNTTFFPSQTLTMTPGGTFNLAVQAGTAFNQGFRIWIDYNNDGDFSDPGEDVYASATANTVVNTGSVVIPPATTPGPKRMRVMCIYNLVPNSTDYCATGIGFGETEEYTLIVAEQCVAPRTAVTGYVGLAPAVTVTAGATSLCDGDSTTLSAASANAGYAYTWSPATDLNTTSGDTVIFTPSSPGSYTYYLTAFDAVSGCTYLDTLSLSLSLRPTFTLTTSDDSVCGNTQTQLNTVIPSSIVQITNSNTLNSSTSYPAPYGQFYGGSRHQMLILASELTAAGMTAGYYSGMTFQVTNTNASAALMDFNIQLGLTTAPDLSTGFVSVPMQSVYYNASYAPNVGINTHSFSSAFFWDGVSNILVETCFANYTSAPNTTFTTNCTMRQIITPFTSTAWNRYDNTANICGIAYQFTANQRPNMAFMRSTSSWTYGWTPTATVASPSSDTTLAYPPMTQYYTMTVTDTTSGCAGVDSILINVLPTPAPALGVDTVICSNANIVLDGGMGNYTYLWQDSVTTSQTFTTNVFGVYSVVVTDTASGCIGSDTIVVGINAAPSFTLGADATVCQGTQVSFSGPSGSYDYLWNTLDSTMSITVGTAGSYELSVTDQANGCTSMDTVALTVNPVPVVTLGNDTSVCSASGSLTLSAPAGSYDYMWNTLDSSMAIAVNSTGNYYVIVTDTTTSCFSGDTIMVTYNASPVANIGNDTTFCSANGPITLVAPAGPYAYMWNTLDSSMTISAGSTGIYSVTVLDTLTGCTTADSVNVIVNMSPSFTLADTSLCGTQYTINGPAGPYAYSWSTLDSTSSITVTASGTYSLMVTDVASGCTGTDASTININANPTVTASGSDLTPCEDDANVILTGGPVGGTFTGPSVTGSQFDPSVGAGTYQVIYNFTDVNGCSGADTLSIVVDDCVGIDEQFAGSGMNIYPNPNAGQFTFYASEMNCEKLTIEIVSVEGQVIMSSQYSNVQGTFTQEIDLNDFANGVYIMRVITDGTVYTNRVIKQD